MLFKRKTTTQVPTTVDLPVTGPTVKDQVYAGANRAIDKASQVYHKNPKLLGGLALLAGALVLNRMTRPHA